MNDVDAPPPLPAGYPDPVVVGWARTTEVEYGGLSIQMTITPGDRIVKLWELVDGHPVRWVGNVFRVGSCREPLLRLNCHYQQAIPLISQQDQLARMAGKFWSG